MSGVEFGFQEETECPFVLLMYVEERKAFNGWENGGREAEMAKRMSRWEGAG